MSNIALRRFGVVLEAALILLIAEGCGGYANKPRDAAKDSARENGATANSTATGRDDHRTEPDNSSRDGSDASRGETPKNAARDDSAGSDQRDAPLVARRDARGRKWIGDIPYDVWFDDPLAVAGQGADFVSTVTTSESTSTSTSSATSAPDSGMNRAPDAPTKSRPSGNADASVAPSASASKTDWKSLVSADVLDGEVKTLRNGLTDALKSVGRYNARYQDVRTMGTTLATVAEIAREHPESLSWKSKAGSIRDLGRKIEESAKGVGSASYEAARALFETLGSVLNGNEPAGLGAPAANPDFSEFADRSGVMKRMDQAFQWLKKYVGDEQTLRKNSDQALHEASLLAAFGRVVTVGRYSSAEEDAYKKHVDELVVQSLKMAAAAKSADFSQFETARNRVEKKCNECHAAYRFE